MSRIKAMSEHQDFVRKSEDLVERLRKQINRVPQKGNKTEDCQHLTLLNALNNLSHAINGTTPNDFIP